MNAALHPNRHVLESGKRFSESMLWQILHAFYTRQGLDAWQDNTIPHYITCNPTIADAYARVVLGYLQDCLHTGPAVDRPFYILELGAGSGRFAFLFLHRLLEHMERLGQSIPFVYVMSDFSPTIVAGWQQHPALQPLVARGVLDFAQFNPVQDREVHLIHRDTVLTAHDFNTPAVVLANYVFDSLPQDLFRIEKGRLFELLVTLVSPQSEADLSDPTLLARLRYEYTPAEVSGGYYDDPGLDAVLAQYTTWPDTGTLNFPLGAMRCYQNLLRLFGGQMLLLSADRGFIQPDTAHFEGVAKPHNGAFSLPMNFHALAAYTGQQGGTVLQIDHAHASLCVAAFISGDTRACHRETARAFAEVNEFGPDDFFLLTRGIETYYDVLTLDEVLALLRFSKGDVRVLRLCLPVLRGLVAEATPIQKDALRREIARAWSLYYHLGDSFNLPFELGALLHQLGLFGDALFYYQQAQALYGDEMELLYNMAICHHKLGAWALALQTLAHGQGLMRHLPPLLRRHTDQRFASLHSTIQAAMTEG